MVRCGTVPGVNMMIYDSCPGTVWIFSSSSRSRSRSRIENRESRIRESRMSRSSSSIVNESIEIEYFLLLLIGFYLLLTACG